MEPLVAVLSGGSSPEHDVSVVSAAEVLNGLRARGYRTRAVFIDRRGGWHLVEGEPGPDGEAWTPSRLVERGTASPARHALLGVEALARQGASVVFPALHGKGGEDGSVQALVAAAGLRCVGSGQAASAVGMSKLLTRLAFTGAGLPMARAYMPSRCEALNLTADEVVHQVAERGLRYPVFLKEDACGSSLNVERIERPEDLAESLARVRAAGDYWLLEEGVRGIELTVAVLGNSGGDLRGLPPVEIRPKHSSFFDYASKYDGEATDEICPPPSLTGEECRCVQDLAVAAHEALGCRGFSRTDMILGLPERQAVLLEINTIPGLTPQSLLPRAARTAGLEFPDLMVLLVELALEGSERAVELPQPAAS